MATNTELLAKVKDWANRSDLSDSVTQDFLEIAQKRINSMLRIAPMETIVMYTGITEDQTTLAIPSDLIEIISIRVLNDDNSTKYIYESKVDTRTFDRINAGEYGTSNNNYTFTRRAGDFVLSNKPGSDAKVQLYYYRVLPKLDAPYPSTEVNCTTMGSVAAGTWSNPGGEGVCDPVDGGLIGDEVPQWFRDEAEFLLLYGALVEVASYLGEDGDMQKWEIKFQQKIKEIMDDEFKRENSGGTLTQNFGTNGLI